jgi:hypothetical protein
MSKKARLDMTTVAVVGSGARELAVARALKSSPRCAAVRCFGAEPNPAIAELAGAVEVGDEAAPAAVLEFCKSCKADLVVVMSAVSLAAGVVDALQVGGVRAIGARQAAAAVAQNDFARGLMKQACAQPIPLSSRRCIARHRFCSACELPSILFSVLTLLRCDGADRSVRGARMYPGGRRSPE